MKLESIKSAVKCHGALAALVACAALGCFVACGSYSTRGAGDPFVGTWSCPSLPAGARSIAISENADSSLTLTADTDGGSPFCATDLWTFSSSTASMKAGTSCLGGASGAQVLTIHSFVVTVSGNLMSVSGSETVGGPGSTSQNVTLASTCKKQ